MAKSSIPSDDYESQSFKKCTGCGETKPVSEFHKQADKKDGLRTHCKVCKAKSDKIYREIHQKEINEYRKKNKDKIAAQRKEYYEANKPQILKLRKEYRESHKAEWREYYDVNKEHLSDYNREYRKVNITDIKARHERYRKENKERIVKQYKAYMQTEEGKNNALRKCQKRRALKKKVDYEVFDASEVFERDGYRCQLCGRKTRPDFNQWHSLYPNLDHIIPLSKGGAHTKKNTQCLCHKCNVVKNNKGKGDQLRLFG